LARAKAAEYLQEAMAAEERAAALMAAKINQ